MPRGYKTQGKITVRAIYKDQPDLRRIAHALVEMAHDLALEDEKLRTELLKAKLDEMLADPSELNQLKNAKK